MVLSKDDRIKRGHERRFGKSMLPLEVYAFDEVYADTRRKVFDPENRCWTVWNVNGRRVRCVAESSGT